jgi:NitT/TauT family transport system permease protein
MLNLEAIGCAILISLGLAYLSVVPLFKPLVELSTSLRFLSMAGLSVAFAVAIPSPHTVKVAMLTFSISVWFITSMLDVIRAIPQEQYDLARTLRMGRWRVVWEVVVLGQIDKAFDVLRQTAAMGWMMLTLVESIVFAEGGVGTVLQTMQKHARFGDIMAIQICILILGVGQDYGIGVMKNLFCPYANTNGGKH